MEVFIGPLVGLIVVVTIICAVIIASSRKGRTSASARDIELRRLERNQERFYRQQSWLFWKDLFK